MLDFYQTRHVTSKSVLKQYRIVAGVLRVEDVTMTHLCPISSDDVNTDSGAGTDTVQDEAGEDPGAGFHHIHHVLQLRDAVAVQVQIVEVVVELGRVEDLHGHGVGARDGVGVDAFVGERLQRLKEVSASAAGEVEGLVTQLLQGLPDLPQAVDAGMVHHEQGVEGGVIQRGHAVGPSAAHQQVHGVVHHLVLDLGEAEKRSGP